MNLIQPHSWKWTRTRARIVRVDTFVLLIIRRFLLTHMALKYSYNSSLSEFKMQSIYNNALCCRDSSRTHHRHHPIILDPFSRSRDFLRNPVLGLPAASEPRTCRYCCSNNKRTGPGRCCTLATDSSGKAIRSSSREKSEATRAPSRRWIAVADDETTNIIHISWQTEAWNTSSEQCSVNSPVLMEKHSWRSNVPYEQPSWDARRRPGKKWPSHGFTTMGFPANSNRSIPTGVPRAQLGYETRRLGSFNPHFQ